MKFGLLGTYRHKESGHVFHCDEAIKTRGELVCILTDRKGTEYKRWNWDSSEFVEITTTKMGKTT